MTSNSVGEIIDELTNHFMLVRQALEEEGFRHLRTHFDAQSRFSVEKVLGHSSFGVTFRVLEKLGGTDSRRLTVKLSRERLGQGSLRNEIATLRTLRGAEHISKLIADRDATFAFKGIRQLRRAWAGRVSGGVPIETGLIGLAGPVLVLEYLENGTLAEFFGKMVGQQAVLPNRLLWSIFLCLVRACIGMAYPVNGKPEDPTRLEAIPAGVAAGNIMQVDLHMGKIMIGSAGGPFSEHRLVPALKLIDFGFAQRDPTAVRQNLWKITLQMYTLITKRTGWDMFWPVVPYKGLQTWAVDLLPPNNQFDWVDPDLADLMARCMANDPQNRPSLEDMLRETDAGARKLSGMYKPPVDMWAETERVIRAVLKLLVYDADVVPNPAGFNAAVVRAIEDAIRG